MKKYESVIKWLARATKDGCHTELLVPEFLTTALVAFIYELNPRYVARDLQKEWLALDIARGKLRAADEIVQIQSQALNGGENETGNSISQC